MTSAIIAEIMIQLVPLRASVSICARTAPHRSRARAHSVGRHGAAGPSGSFHDVSLVSRCHQYQRPHLLDHSTFQRGSFGFGGLSAGLGCSAPPPPGVMNRWHAAHARAHGHHHHKHTTWALRAQMIQQRCRNQAVPSAHLQAKDRASSSACNPGDAQGQRRTVPRQKSA
jgi:hypothetical protein